MKTHIFLTLLVVLTSIGCAQSETKLDPKKEVVCFVYHRFDDDRYPSTNTKVSDFKSHLQYLKDQGYQVLTFADAIDYMNSSDPVQKTAVITIDDGYESFYKNGLPVLKEFDFPATLYINTETVGGSSYMDWDQIKAAAYAGIEIGNHTHSHAYFLNQPESERYSNFKDELKLTQKLIKEHLGSTPETFAYPFGELDDKMLSIVKEIGFKGAAAQNSGVIGGSTDLFRCPRFPMSENYAAFDKFKSKANMHHPMVASESPSSFMATGDQPKLTLTVAADNPLAGAVNCFIQGAEAQVDKSESGEDVIITVTPKSDISSRRRFLYTLTAQQNGQWYWYSHLWINPDVN